MDILTHITRVVYTPWNVNTRVKGTININEMSPEWVSFVCPDFPFFALAKTKPGQKKEIFFKRRLFVTINPIKPQDIIHMRIYRESYTPKVCTPIDVKTRVESISKELYQWLLVFSFSWLIKNEFSFFCPREIQIGAKKGKFLLKFVCFLNCLRQPQDVPTRAFLAWITHADGIHADRRETIDVPN